MASRTVFARPGRFLWDAELCVFCSTRQHVRSLQHHALQNASTSRMPRPLRVEAERRTCQPQQLRRKSMKTRVAMTPQERRNQLDKHNRNIIFSKMAKDKHFKFAAADAEKIYSKFVALKDMQDPDEARALAKKHGKTLSDITAIAHGIYRCPPVDDPRFPPSPHKRHAKNMWLAMSKALEPNAVLHINRAVLLREKLPAAQEVAAQYSQAELRTAFENLAELALKKHPDAMSLLGQFYEKQGLKQRATKLYEQAVNQYTAKESKKANKEKLAQPMQLPQLAPWNALGFILMTEKDPESLKQAEEAFRIGALDHDDPLSYYHLATFQTRHSGDWLQYMTKAAGSGHLEAMYELGEFYSEANQAYINPELANDKVLNKLMSWILDWKPQKLKALADEWFTTAASAGYKPAMWKLAEDLERGNTDGQDTEGALHWYKIIAGAPQFDKEERWPKLVDQARRKLQTVKRKV